MLLPEGGFASSLDADSEHEEGKFYVWSEAEIDRLLGARAQHFKEIYDVTPDGNWEGKTILNRLDHLALLDDAEEDELRAARALLFEARTARVRPGLDDKVLADWNGLMIAALAVAGSAFGRDDWLARAAHSFDFVVQNLGAADGRLMHAWRAGKRAHTAVLDDYANMSRAALLLYEATGEVRFLETARRWVGICDAHYRDPRGGYFFTADDAEALLVRTKQAMDQPNPSGNGTLVEVFARLHHLTGEEMFRARAEEVIAAFSGELQQQPLRPRDASERRRAFAARAADRHRRRARERRHAGDAARRQRGAASDQDSPRRGARGGAAGIPSRPPARAPSAGARQPISARARHARFP